MTVNFVRGVELVLPDGSVVETGGVTEDNPGYDLPGIIVGHEGTFGIATRVTVGLTRDPEAGRTLLGVFDGVDAATETVSGIIAAGIVPAALEMLDNLMIRAVEAAFGFGFPTEAGAVLIIEVDGLDAGLDREAQAIAEIVRTHGGSVQKSIAWRTRKEPEYVAIWKSRKSAFGAIGRLSPTFCTQDGVVPRTKLPHILRHITKVGERYGLRIANVFHAGDGNIHPILLFDERDADQVARVLKASHEILDECIAVGGSVTGEHGIGVEKMEFMPKLFSPEDLAAMIALRECVQPDGLLQPRQDDPRRRRLHRAEVARAQGVGLNRTRTGAFMQRGQATPILAMAAAARASSASASIEVPTRARTRRGSRSISPRPARPRRGAGRAARVREPSRTTARSCWPRGSRPSGSASRSPRSRRSEARSRACTRSPTTPSISPSCGPRRRSAPARPATVE